MGLKSFKPKTFKFEEGQNWDGDEEIMEHIENLLIDWENLKPGDFAKVKQKTYITIMGAKEVRKPSGRRTK